MSWIDQAQEDFVIITGDGKRYTPKWLKPSVATEYNVAEFNFPGVAGTLVARQLPRGRKYAVELYFDGEYHLEVSAAFLTSADDSRPWNVTHPYYGRILVQPTSLLFDNSDYNITKVTGILLGTIGNKQPSGTVAPLDKVQQDNAATQSNLASSYADTTTPTAADINQMTGDLASSYARGTRNVDASAAEKYNNAFNTANGAVLNATAEPLAAMRSIQAVIAAPALFKQSVNSRVALLGENLSTLRANTAGINFNQKQLFQAQSGTLLSAMSLAALNPQQGDYANKNDVLGIIEEVLLAYNTYLGDLGTLQDNNGGTPLSFIPDANSLSSLSQLLNFAVANLLEVAQAAKQERGFILEDDSNWVLLTHRLYGIDAANTNITRLISENNAGLSEMLYVRKGRAILYYI